MEVGQDVKQRYLAMAEPVKDGDHVPVFKQIFSDRATSGLTGEESLCIESCEELYRRVLNLR